MALFDEARKNGFVEGANLSVDADGWRLTEEQFPVHAGVLVKARVDVIICSEESAVRAAQKATKTISTFLTPVTGKLGLWRARRLM